jgi:hypothetical protein
MTIYPSGIDSTVELPDVVDNVTHINAVVINSLRDVLFAIEGELGINPSGTYATVRARLDYLEDNAASGAALTSNLQGFPITTATPLLDQFLGWNGTHWTPTYITADMIKPAFTLGISGGTTLTVGQTLTMPAFTASYSQSISSAVLTDNLGSAPKNVFSTQNAFNSNATITKHIFNDSATFTLTAASSGGVTKSASTNFVWLQPNYYGVGAAGQNNPVFIQNLGNSFLASSRATTFSTNANSTQKVYYAHRTGFGVASFSVGGFSGGFSLVSTTIPVTNSYGVTENYTLYESDNLALGAISVIVS